MSRAPDSSTAPRGCLYEIKNADACIHVIRGAVVIVAALAAIAFLTSVLAVLAQQGYHLGAINSIVQTISSKWIYLAMGAAAIVFALDTSLLIALIARCKADFTNASEKIQEISVDPGAQTRGVSKEFTGLRIRKGGYGRKLYEGTKGSVYSVISDKKDEQHLTFTSSEAREDFIRTYLPSVNFCDLDELESQIIDYKVKNKLVKRCPLLKDYISFTLPVHQRSIAVIFYRNSEGHFQYEYGLEHAQAFAMGGTFCPDKGFTNVVVREEAIRKTGIIPEALAKFWLSEADYETATAIHTSNTMHSEGYYVAYFDKKSEKDSKIFVLAIGGAPKSVMFFVDAKTRSEYITKNLQATHHYYDIDEYPEIESQFLIGSNGMLWSEKTVRNSCESICDREFRFYGKVLTKIVDIPEVYPIFERDDKGVVRIHYFKSAMRADACLDELLAQKYTNFVIRRKRNDTLTEFVKFVGPAVLKQHQKPFYMFCQSDPNIYLVTCALDGSMASSDYTPEAYAVRRAQLDQTHVRIEENDALYNLELGSNEKEYLDIALKAAPPGGVSNFESWITNGRLLQKQFVTRKKLNERYTCLLIRHEHQEGRRFIEISHFRTHSKALKAKLDSLKGYIEVG